MQARKFEIGDEVVLTEEARRNIANRTYEGDTAYEYPSRTIFRVTGYNSKWTSDVHLTPYEYGIADFLMWNEVWLEAYRGA